MTRFVINTKRLLLLLLSGEEIRSFLMLYFREMSRCSCEKKRKLIFIFYFFSRDTSISNFPELIEKWLDSTNKTKKIFRTSFEASLDKTQQKKCEIAKKKNLELLCLLCDSLWCNWNVLHHRKNTLNNNNKTNEHYCHQLCCCVYHHISHDLDIYGWHFIAFSSSPHNKIIVGS